MNSISSLNSFKKFYPFYLSQHQNKVCRSLHYFGTTMVLLYLFMFFFRFPYASRFWPIFLLGYIPAWIGHFFFEKNRPATFRYPIYSLMGDFKMYFEWIVRIILPRV